MSKTVSHISKQGYVERELAFDALLMIGQGGIVFDSDPYDEWMETINKLGSLISLSNILTARANKAD